MEYYDSDFGGFLDNCQIPDYYCFDLGDVSFELHLQDSVVPNQMTVDWDGRSNARFEWNQAPNGLYSYATHLDLDGDGHFDLAAEDVNGDFWPDIVSWDVDGPGGQSYSTPTSSAGAVSFLDESISSGLDAWATLDTLVSEPANLEGFETSLDSVSLWSEQWHPQVAEDSCAICCQEFIIEAATGKEITEREMIDIAKDLGVYRHGTAPQDMGAILDYFGIENSVQDGFTFDDLVSAVNSGRGVSVAVDSSELMGMDDWGEALGIPLSHMDHAVQVTGFESNSAGDFVVINDPGHQHGCANQIPVDRFLDAWADSNNFACVTNKSIV